MDGKKFYAVSNGTSLALPCLQVCTIVHPFELIWKLTRIRGRSGDEKEGRGEHGACYKHFRTKLSLEDLKETHAEVWREIIKEALDRNLRPRSIEVFEPRGMGLIIDRFLHTPVASSEVEDITLKIPQKLSL